MPVNSEHPEYTKRKKQWQRCRHVTEGADVVKENGVKYLPHLSGMDGNDYDTYKTRSPFYNASGRTVQGLVGAVFRKPPHKKFPDPYTEQLDYMTANGLDLEGFANLITRTLVSEGRIGVLLDAGADGTERRAYAAVYDAANIINWRVEKIGNKNTLTMLVLREQRKKVVDDEFDHETEDQYRVLRLERNAATGARTYKQEVWVKDGDKEKWKRDPKQDVTPTRSGVVFDEIPFVIMNAEDLTWATCKPPVLDLVNTNIDHYRLSADLYHGLHFTALPTPWVAGFPKGSKLSIGSGVAWVSENTDAHAGYLEFTGAGLAAISTELDKLESRMAILGARLLEEQKAAVEAAETQKVRRAGENGALAAVVKVASSGIEQVLRWMLYWSQADHLMDEVEFEMNTDFVSATLTPQELAELTKTWQQGGISQDTYLYNLKRGEVIPHERTIEEEKELLESEGGGFSDRMGGGADAIPLRRNFQIVRDSSGKAMGITEGGQVGGIEGATA